jgi:NCAIR mutase (PurE)-related protein
MRHDQIRQILAQLLRGALSPDAAIAALTAADGPQFAGEAPAEMATGHAAAADHPATWPVARLDEVTLDLDRQRRCGFPEVVFGPSKSLEALRAIVQTLLKQRQGVLITRLEPPKAEALLREFPTATYHARARTFRIDGSDAAPPAGRVAIVTAGTSDLSVAEEAEQTAQWMGTQTELIKDVGVAGLQRILLQRPRLAAADAVVVVAGMEAALASVVGGLVACPVIAVPTSVGYGTHLGGLAALLGMLNSCAANVAVVNIDAGFKGGYLAAMIARRAAAGHVPSSLAATPGSETPPSKAGATQVGADRP